MHLVLKSFLLCASTNSVIPALTSYTYLCSNLDAKHRVTRKAFKIIPPTIFEKILKTTHLLKILKYILKHFLGTINSKGQNFKSGIKSINCIKSINIKMCRIAF